ncbi:type I restriction-modification enzyme R subunit C-terminal domain-containing protein, partial [Rhodonellum psychrophilum]
EYVENVRKAHDQIIDTVNQDTVTKSEWDRFTTEKAQQVIQDFTTYIEQHKDEIIALSIFYDQPYRIRELTFKMIQEVMETLKLERPTLAPNYVWEAYKQLDQVKENSPKNELVSLVSLIRKVSGIDQQLIPYDRTVNENFQKWIFRQNAGQHNKFTEDQMSWLRMIKDHMATSFHLEMEDLDFTPFDSQGGRGKMWNLFGTDMFSIIDEMNINLAS